MKAGSQLRSRDSALVIDLYELTMAAAYFAESFNPRATFELFFYSLPPERSFLLAAGLEEALAFLEGLRFRAEEIDFLRSLPIFSKVRDEFFDYLTNFRFRGDVWATPEGTPVFAGEALLQVCAPIIEAQLVETCLLSLINFETAVATKAARITEAAEGRVVVEFGSRRAHGPQAGVLAARAAFLGGCSGTSNVEAGFRFGIPVFGTMGHSFIMAFGSEERAFRQFEQLFPGGTTLLLDTYDTLSAVEKIIRLGLHPQGVRLDSGDLIGLSRQVRSRLDRAGLRETRILASGDLDEFVISDLIAAGAQINGFGVGTRLATSSDVPALPGVYKLVELEIGSERAYRAKFSDRKQSYPAKKQVFRFRDDQGRYAYDVIASASEMYPEAEPLLVPVMHNGVRTAASPTLTDAKRRAEQNLSLLPEPYRRIRDPETYPVRISGELDKLFETVRIEQLQAAEQR